MSSGIWEVLERKEVPLHFKQLMFHSARLGMAFIRMFSQLGDDKC